jgi:hypothetical protein
LTYIIRDGLPEANPKTVGQVVPLLSNLQGSGGGEGSGEAEGDGEADELHYKYLRLDLVKNSSKCKRAVKQNLEMSVSQSISQPCIISIYTSLLSTSLDQSDQPFLIHPVAAKASPSPAIFHLLRDPA